MNVQQYFRAPKVVAGGLPYTPPLDLVPGAIAAFSVRKLRSGYTGACMRVIDKDSGTKDINFDSFGLLNTSEISSFSIGTGRLTNNIFYDQSGNANNLIEPSYGLGPLLRDPSNNLIFLDSIPALLIASVGGAATAEQLSMAFSSKISIKSAFLVFKMNSIALVNYVSYSGADNDGLYLGGAVAGANGFSVVKANTLKVGNTTENTNKRLHSFFGGSTNKVFTDSVNEATSATSIDSIFIKELGRTTRNGGGSNLSSNGYLQEAIFYDFDVFSDKAILENNINSYFSIY